MRCGANLCCRLVCLCVAFAATVTAAPSPADTTENKSLLGAKALDEAGRRLQILELLACGSPPVAWLHPSTQPVSGVSATLLPTGIAKADVSYLPNEVIVDLHHSFATTLALELRGVASKEIKVKIINVDVSQWAQPSFVWERAPSDAAMLNGGTSEHDGGPRLISLNLVEHSTVPDRGWRSIDDQWIEGRSIVIRNRWGADVDNVAISLRVPFTAADLDREVRKVALAADPSLIRTEFLGPAWPDSHAAIFVLGDDPSRNDKPCILLYAREHANEYDSSWALDGVIEAALARDASILDILQRFTVVAIPIFDLEGAKNGVYAGITDEFAPFVERPARNPVVSEYKSWLEKWYSDGRHFALVVPLHNTAPGPYLSLNCPLIITSSGSMDEASCDSLYASVARAAISAGFTVRPDAWSRGGNITTRFSGWMQSRHAVLVLPLELNSVGPIRMLRTAELGRLGVSILGGLSQEIGRQADAK